MSAARGLIEEKLTRSVINSFFAVHGELGFGYREFMYVLALERDLIAKGHKVDREVSVMVYFRGEPLAGQRLDMIVDDKLVVEARSTEHLHPGSSQVLFSYLCATDLEVGLLLHFGWKARFYRVVCENRLKRRSRSPE